MATRQRAKIFPRDCKSLRRYANYRLETTIISQTRDAHKVSDENDRQIKDLREKYNRATSQAERDRIIKQMNDADSDFLANQKGEEGNKLYYAKDYRTYNNRGVSYDNLGQKERAIQDYSKAIQLNPNNTLAKNNREACLKALGK